MLEFTILLHPATKKNNMNVGRNRYSGKTFVSQNRKYLDYEKQCVLYMPKTDLIDYPVNIKAIFYVKDKRKRDLTNLHAALHDILVKYDILKDDNYNVVASTDGSRVYYDKENPRTEVTITKMEE